MAKHRHSLALGLLVFLGGLLVFIQYVTIGKFAVLSPSASHITLVNFVAAVHEQILFSKLDGVLVSLLFASIAYGLYKEIRSKIFSDYLHGIFSSKRNTLYLFSICSLVCIRYYFARGELSWAGDASHHIATAQLAAMAIRDGELPIWTFFMGNGSPYLQNYGFAFFYLIGLVDLLWRDIFLSLKLVMAASHLLSGIGMYCLAARLCRSRRAGFIAGLAYVLCFWHTQHVLIMGRLALSLFYALLPWTFYAVECLINSRYKVRSAVLGGMGIALMNFTHPGFGLYAMLLLGLYSIARLWSCLPHRDLKVVLWAGMLLFALGVSLGSYMNVGMWLELEHTNMHDFGLGVKTVDTPDQIVPDPSWRHVLGWSNFRFWLMPPEPFHWYGGYLGVSLCVVALAGAALAFFARKKHGTRRYSGGLVCLVLVVLLTFAYRLPPISMLQLVQAFNASRYLLFLAFFLALATGIGVHLLLLYCPKNLSRSRYYTLLLVLVLVDLFPTTFLHPYRSGQTTPTGLPPEMFAEIREQATPFIANGELPNYRSQWVTDGVHPFISTARMLFMGATPTADAFHPGELRALNTFTHPFTDVARNLLMRLDSPEQVYSHKYGHLIRAGFSLLNTHYVLVTSRQQGAGFLLSLNEHSPIVVSSRLLEYDDNAVAALDLHEDLSRTLGLDELDSLGLHMVKRVLWIISLTGIDFENRSCERIIVRDHERERDLGTAPTAQVIAHSVGHQRVTMRVAVSETCYARLAYAYFPFLEITVDGKPVQPMETAGRFIAIELEQGEHDIVIQARVSPLRMSLIVFAAMFTMVAVALVVSERRRIG